MSRESFYVTTPIYYVNDLPHIGHAYSSLASDVVARFNRLDGKDVFFLTGTDEHGQKVEKSAEKKAIAPQEFTDHVSQSFRDLSSLLNFSNDDFIRTTEPRHQKSVKAFWKKLYDNGYIYEGEYSGWYSIRDEAFYSESEIAGGRAPTGAPVEWVSEPSYFFKLSAWQDRLLEFYEQNPDFIYPQARRNEVINFVKSGLTDLSVSRTSFKWGIKVEGNEKHVIYVWLDALTNYIAALDYPGDSSGFMKKFWPANMHIVGKDILRFHAIYWPAFLMAADITPPKKIVAHGWWTNEGEKISKSVGNVIDPNKLVQEHGQDQVRYFLMREVIFGSDGNYTEELMINRVNSELSNNIGNLVQRTLSMIFKNCNEQIPEVISKDAYKEPPLQLAVELLEKIRKEMERPNFSAALDMIIRLSSECNLYIDQQAPWTLKKTDPDRMRFVLYTLAESVRYLAILLQAFVPISASKILDQLGVDEKERNFSNLSIEHSIKQGKKISHPEVIFPRIHLVE